MDRELRNETAAVCIRQALWELDRLTHIDQHQDPALYSEAANEVRQRLYDARSRMEAKP
jgi:hypothetical protein